MTRHDADGRVDVRAFPSDLTLLLLLLAASVLAGDFFFARWLAESRAPVDCSGASYAAGNLVASCPKDAGAVFTGTLTVLVQVLLPGIAGFAFASRLRIRRHVPLETSPFRGAAETVRALVAAAALPASPTLLVGQRLRAGAHVAGPPGRPHLVLGPELLAMHDKGGSARRVFDVVVRHELAHLQARDLWLHFMVTVLRWSNVYAGAFALFTVILDLGYGNGATASDLLAAVSRVVLLTLLGELIARAFLRLREHEADLRGGAADREALIAAVRGGVAGQGTARLGAWLRHHPLGAERLGVALAPDRILASSPGRLFLGATVAGVLFETLQDMLRRTADAAGKPATTLMTGVAVGLPLTLFLAFALWRHHWYAGRTGPGRLVATAGVLTVGVVGGSHLALFTQVSGFSEAGYPLDPLLLAGLFCGLLLLCAWTTALGALHHRTDPGATRMPAFLTLTVPAVSVVGGWLFALLWTWAARLQGVRLGCAAEENRAVPLCLSGSPGRDIAVSVVETFDSVPVLVVVVLVAVAAPLLIRAGAGGRARRGRPVAPDAGDAVE
ncbi:hypothetical protein [Streptomyces hebeiensis]